MVYRNIKNQKLYKVIDTMVFDKTEGQDNKQVVLYKDERGQKYVRYFDEFFQKFSITTFDKIPKE